MFLVARAPSISEERFHYHYRHIHGELARETLSRPSGGLMNRYVQSHRIGTSLDGLPSLPFEAVGEAWFDSEVDLQTSYERPSFLQRVVPDEQRFADLTRSVWFNTRSCIRLRASQLPPAAARIIILIRRRDDIGDDDFRNAWRAHATQFLDTPGLIEYVQTEVVSEAPQPRAEGPARPLTGWTALESLTFPDVFEIDRRWPTIRGPFLGDLASFAQVDACASLVAALYRIY